MDYSLSVNIGDFNGYKVNVVYPYSSSRLHIFKYYGKAMLFNNTILITKETFETDSKIKEYILTHEQCHFLSKKLSIIQFTIVILFLVGLIFIPEIFEQLQINNNLIVFMPLTVFLIYRFTLAKNLYLKSELLADEFAVKTLGKGKVLEALHLLNESSGANKKSSYSLFSMSVPIERRIKFVNEYAETKV